jgi:deoxyadenosine/deoxycytidine kinase
MWLAIEGIVGAGKTTTADLLGERTGLVATLEPTDRHPLLDAYYADPRRFALATELVFMALQAHQVTAIGGPGFVSDFAPAKNFVFARLSCDAADLALLEAVDRRLWRDLPRPDLTVVLDVPAEVCLERIARRGRGYELGLGVADLERLRAGYERSLPALGADVRRIALTGAESPDEVADAAGEIAGLAAAI